MARLVAPAALFICGIARAPPGLLGRTCNAAVSCLGGCSGGPPSDLVHVSGAPSRGPEAEPAAGG